MMARTFAPRQLRGTQPIRYAEVEGQWRSSGLAGVFILPEPGTDAYAAAAATGPEQVFDRSTWVNLFDVGDLRVAIPRFKVAVSQLSLVGALRSLGVAAAFDPAAADFSRISQQPLYITQVVQSVRVSAWWGELQCGRAGATGVWRGWPCATRVADALPAPHRMSLPADLNPPTPCRRWCTWTRRAQRRQRSLV
jgi:hypothetical protein